MMVARGSEAKVIGQLVDYWHWRCWDQEAQRLLLVVLGSSEEVWMVLVLQLEGAAGGGGC